MANTTKKIVKKKSKKQKNMQPKVVDDKAEKSQKAREEQYAKLEKSKLEAARNSTDHLGRLKEALILSEIVGRPRCKQRQNRGNSRRYGS